MPAELFSMMLPSSIEGARELIRSMNLIDVKVGLGTPLAVGEVCEEKIIPIECQKCGFAYEILRGRRFRIGEKRYIFDDGNFILHKQIE